MNGFNVGVLVSLGDMELALDYLNDEKVFEPEITEYQKDRRQIAEKQKISDIGHGTFELNTQSHSNSIRESDIEEEPESYTRGVEVDNGTVVQPPEDELNEWDETYSNEYTSSDDSDEFEEYSDEYSDEFEESDDSDEFEEYSDEFEEDEDKFEEYSDESEDEDDCIDLSDDEEYTSEQDEYTSEQDEYTSEQEEYTSEQDNDSIELERQILEAQKKLKEAKERKDRAIAAKKALKEKLERTLMEINKLENESEALETENKHASELLSEVEKDKSLGDNNVLNQESFEQGKTNAKAARNEAVHQGDIDNKQIRENKGLRNKASRLNGTQNVRHKEIAKPVPQKVHKPNTQPKESVKVNKEEQYGSLDIDTLYTKVVQFMMMHGVSKSAIDKSILDTEFGVMNINKLIMKSYLISMGKKVTIGK